MRSTVVPNVDNAVISADLHTFNNLNENRQAGRHGQTNLGIQTSSKPVKAELKSMELYCIVWPNAGQKHGK